MLWECIYNASRLFVSACCCYQSPLRHDWSILQGLQIETRTLLMPKTWSFCIHVQKLFRDLRDREDTFTFFPHETVGQHCNKQLINQIQYNKPSWAEETRSNGIGAISGGDSLTPPYSVFCYIRDASFCIITFITQSEDGCHFVLWLLSGEAFKNKYRSDEALRAENHPSSHTCCTNMTFCSVCRRMFRESSSGHACLWAGGCHWNYMCSPT